MNYKFTRYEMETSVIFNAEEKTATLYTRDKAVMRRLNKFVKEFPDIFKCIAKTDVDATYEFPKKYAMPKRPRIMSEERRAEMAERLAKARAAQDKETVSELEDELDDEFDDELDEEQGEERENEEQD